MKRWKRIGMNLLLPPLVAATLFSAVGLVISFGQRPIDFSNLGQSVLLVLFFAYFYAVLPSLACAIWMERMYAGGVSPASGRALVASGLCGTVSGTLIAFLISLHSTLERDTWTFIFILAAGGAIIGLVVGVLVGSAEKRARARV